MAPQARRPSPALVISFIALAVAISGTAVAAKGGVDTRDLENKAVTSKKIASKAVTKKKLAKDAVDASRLATGSVTADALAGGAVGTTALADGSVTAAKVASDAIGTANVQNNSLNDTKFSDYEVVGNSFVRVPATDGSDVATAQSVAPEVELFTKGPLTIYAKCFRDTGAATIYGRLFAKTSVDGAIKEGDPDLPLNNATLLNVATPEADRQLDSQSTAAANAGNIGEEETAVMAPDGTSLTLVTNTAVKQGTLAGGNGAFGDGNVCLFGGAIFG